MTPAELLPLVWREACRHIEIAECVANIARMLDRAAMPIGQLTIRRIGRDRATVETVARGVTAASAPATNESITLAPRVARRLVEWCRAGQATVMRAGGQRASRRTAFLANIVSASAPDADVIIGPLAGEHGAAGLLILHAAPNATFTSEHLRLAGALLEPFAVALENDLRLHELRELREAAEADKRSLLARLGRNDLSDTIVGVAGGLAPVMQRVELVRRSDVPVLILGETGSGKEVIARAIHMGSNRAAKPFIRVNCGAIPPELIDSELFGHEKGSFTGATATRRGWFERADGGTLFLDEIGELPRAAQVRLLRILQDGTLNRVGSETALHVDVRIIAATHRDLPAMVQNGTFREDLWYRIAVFSIVLPPLRERPADIPALAEHFARRAATRFGLKLQLPTPADLSVLTTYAWPGNVRELQSVIDRAAILGDGERLEVARALGVGSSGPSAVAVDAATAAPPARPPTAFSREMLDAERPRPASHAPREIEIAPIAPLDEAIKRHIERALEQTCGRVEGPHGAARLLSINPHTLRSRMRKLRIDRRRFRLNDRRLA